MDIAVAILVGVAVYGGATVAGFTVIFLTVYALAGAVRMLVGPLWDATGCSCGCCTHCRTRRYGGYLTSQGLNRDP